MKIIICKDDTSVWSSHEIDAEAAGHLLWELREFDWTPLQSRPDTAPGDVVISTFLGDLMNAVRQTYKGEF